MEQRDILQEVCMEKVFYIQAYNGTHFHRHSGPDPTIMKNSRFLNQQRIWAYVTMYAYESSESYKDGAKILVDNSIWSYLCTWMPS
jgi:hypothetical protein